MKYINGRLTYSDPKMVAIVIANRKRLAKQEIREGAIGIAGVFLSAFYALGGLAILGLFLQLVTGNLT